VWTCKSRTGGDAPISRKQSEDRAELEILGAYDMLSEREEKTLLFIAGFPPYFNNLVAVWFDHGDRLCYAR
jgi:hypothetical protein